MQEDFNDKVFLKNCDNVGKRFCLYACVRKRGEKCYLEKYRQIRGQMGRTPPWAEGLVLRADGYCTEFYKND
jgi:hypothetical protein